MRPIDGKAKSISELLKDKHYGIDYYQRESKLRCDTANAAKR